MIAMRRAGGALLGAAALLGALGCALVAVLLFSYMAGPLEPHDGTCIGGRTGWAWLQLAIAAVSPAAAGTSVVVALRGRVPRLPLLVAVAAAVVWFALVMWVIPDAGSVC